MLSGFGLAMGVASLYGYTQGIEPYLWIGIAIVGAGVLVRRAKGRLFANGFAVGFMDGIWNGVIEASFFSTYSANNPDAIARFQDGQFSLSPLSFLISSPVIGLLYGLFLGLMTWGLGKLRTKPDARPS